MPRPETLVRIPVAIWRDNDFTALTAGAQRMFLCVLTQPELDRTATLPLRPPRWARMAQGLAVDAVLDALGELETAGFIEIDEELQDVRLLRYIRPGMRWHCAGARTSRGHVHPAKLRRVRLAVYGRGGYACRDCGLAFTPPTGYDGSRALVATIVAPDGPRDVFLELDHIHPHALGGPFEVTNLQALCSPCNNRKGASVPGAGR